MTARRLYLLFALALAVPAVAHAQRGSGGLPPAARNPGYQSPAYQTGYERGARSGEDDSRRNREYDFFGKGDYRSGDSGYRREYGDREWYRAEFRRGFEIGYRESYNRNRGGYGYPGNGRGNGNGRGGYGNVGQQAAAFGYNDGWEAGLDDARDRRRFDPAGEGRYRSGDHGYRREYGLREHYQLRYRESFRQGYERGFQEGRRYTNDRPWWSPW